MNVTNANAFIRRKLFIYSFRPTIIFVFASCQDKSTCSLYLGTLETNFLNLVLDINPRSPVNTFHQQLPYGNQNQYGLKRLCVA